MANHVGNKKKCYQRPVSSAAQQGAGCHILLVYQDWRGWWKELQAKKNKMPKLAAASNRLS